MRISMENIENFSGWMGPISRIEAEERLNNKPVGTYLLRQADDVTASIGKNLSEMHHQQILPFLLTAAIEGGEVTDFLILHTKWGWTLYQDDPYLEEYEYFAKFQSLIDSLRPIAVKPLTLL